MRDAVFRGLLKETTYETLDWFSSLVNVETSLISMTLTGMERAFLESDKARATLPQLLRQLEENTPKILTPYAFTYSYVTDEIRPENTPQILAPYTFTYSYVTGES